MLLILLNPKYFDNSDKSKKVKLISATEAEEIFDDLTQTPYDYPLKIPFLKILKKCYMKVFFNELLNEKAIIEEKL